MDVSLAAADSHVSTRIPVPVLFSFPVVYRANYTYVWRSLLRLGVDDAAVDDAVQDVFIVVHRKLDNFEGRAQLRTWLFAIARRVAMRYRARVKRRAVDDEPGETAAEAGRPDEALSNNEALRSLQSWLDELDDDKRAVFVLSEFEEMRAPEIATTLNVNVNTVYARLRAARQHVSRRARRDANLEGYRSVVRLHANHTPSKTQQRRTWVLLAGKLGIGPAAATLSTGTFAGTLTTGTFAKVAVAASLLGGVVVTAAVVTTPTDDKTSVAMASLTGPTMTPPTEREFRAQPQAEHGVSPAPVAAQQQPVAERLEIEPSAMLGRLLTQPVAKKRRVVQDQATAEVAVVPAGVEDPFVAELKLFEQAKLASKRGNMNQTLGLVQRYARMYPKGAFGVEAAALGVRAFCQEQRSDDARKAAASFAQSYPNSKLVAMDSPCG